MLKTTDRPGTLVTPTDEEVLWDIKGVMKYLHVSEWMVREYYRHGGLPYIDLGRKVYRFHRESVKAWAIEREKSSALN